jgi:hypothetical protein
MSDAALMFFIASLTPGMFSAAFAASARLSRACDQLSQVIIAAI